MAKCDECASKFQKLPDKLTAVFSKTGIKLITFKGMAVE